MDDYQIIDAYSTYPLLAPPKSALLDPENLARNLQNLALVRLQQLSVLGNVGFYTKTPIAQPTVTGSRGGNAALASLLTALANLGLIVNSSS